MMVWKGKELTTMGDVLDALRNLEDADEARVFRSFYRASSEWADENLDYATQRCLDPEVARRVTDSSSCGKCGAAGRGVYYSGEKVGRECMNCGLRWVHLRGIVHPDERRK